MSDSPDHSGGDQLVTIDQASQALGRSVPTIYRWLRRGLLERGRRPRDRRTFVTADSIAACQTNGPASISALAIEVRQLRCEVSALRRIVMAAGDVDGGAGAEPNRSHLIDETFERLEEPA